MIGRTRRGTTWIMGLVACIWVIPILALNAGVLPQQVVIVPPFQLWKTLGLIDHMAAVLIPHVSLSCAWSIFLVKSVLEDFPRDLTEAARIDGCGPLTTLTHVVRPNLLSPVFAVGILQVLWTWSALLLPLLIFVLFQRHFTAGARVGLGP